MQKNESFVFKSLSQDKHVLVVLNEFLELKGGQAGLAADLVEVPVAVEQVVQVTRSAPGVIVYRFLSFKSEFCSNHGLYYNTLCSP
jgi:hypothetical protein